LNLTPSQKEVIEKIPWFVGGTTVPSSEGGYCLKDMSISQNKYFVSVTFRFQYDKNKSNPYNDEYYRFFIGPRGGIQQLVRSTLGTEFKYDTPKFISYVRKTKYRPSEYNYPVFPDGPIELVDSNE
jgi:hypothetical protein